MQPVCVSIELIPCCCWDCGTTFGVASNLRRRFVETGGTFYCPNGHGNSYGDGEATKLRKANAQLTSALDQEKAKRREQQQAATESLEAADRRLKATRGVVTRLKNKAAKGTCPCCEQHFPDLEAHMKEAHADFEQKED